MFSYTSVYIYRMNTIVIWCDNIEYQYISFRILWVGTLHSTRPHFFVTHCNSYTHCVNQAAAIITEWGIDANRTVELSHTHKKKEMKGQEGEKKKCISIRLS